MAAGPWKSAGRYSGAGFELLVAVLITAGLGYWLDKRFWGGHGWGVMGGLVLGFAAGLRNLLRSAQGMQRDLEREDARLPPGSPRWKVDENWLHEPPDDDPKP
jgi:putative F0F1-ATPase subunit (Ca2+/Mg2+ transporter)